MESAAVMMTGLSWSTVRDAISAQGGCMSDAGRTRKHVLDYESTDVAAKVVRIIRSYINYVNTKVWRKAG
jgi:UDP-N-acetylglucosamine 2-epimerase (non-hydrolysing)